MFPGFFMGTLFLFLLVRSLAFGPRWGFNRHFARHHPWHAREYEPFPFGWQDPWSWDDPLDHARRPVRAERPSVARSVEQASFEQAAVSGGQVLNEAVAQFVTSLRQRLGASPAQEQALSRAVESLRRATRDLSGEIGQAREHIAQAVRSDKFDESSFDAACRRIDQAVQQMQESARDALASVHATLDRHQRGELGDIVEPSITADGELL